MPRRQKILLGRVLLSAAQLLSLVTLHPLLQRSRHEGTRFATVGDDWLHSCTSLTARFLGFGLSHIAYRILLFHRDGPRFAAVHSSAGFHVSGHPPLGQASTAMVRTLRLSTRQQAHPPLGQVFVLGDTVRSTP